MAVEPSADDYGFVSLFRYASTSDKLGIGVATASTLAVAAGMPAINIIFGGMADEVYTPNAKEAGAQFQAYSVWFALIGGGVGFAAFVQMALSSIFAEQQAPKLRSAYLRAILRQDSAWYDSLEHGAMELPGSIAADAIVIKDGIGFKLQQAMQMLLTFVCSFVAAYIWGWQLAAVMTAAVPLMAGTMAWTMKIMSSETENEAQRYSTAGGFAAETLSNLRTVVAFGGQAQRAKLYHDGVMAARESGLKRAPFTSLGSAVPMSVMFGMFALALWFGAILVTDGDYVNSFSGESWTAGDVLRVFFLMFIGGMMLGQGGVNFAAVGAANGVAKRVMATIDRVPAIDSYSDKGLKIAPADFHGRIVFDKVTFAYPKRTDQPVFRSLNLVCEAGKRTALVGGSGAGKSTIIALVERFYDVDSGVILVDGTDIRDLSPMWLRSQMGLVSQEPVLFGTGTRGSILENIKYGKPDATLEEVEQACRESNADEFIKNLPNKYDTGVGEGGVQLSGGQKQRIAIARAIIRNPKIMLLDEATSALDTANEVLVKEALDRVMLSRTTIVVAHRLSTIRDADCICVVENGKIAEQGTHDELMAKGQAGAYVKLVQRQQMDKADGDGPALLVEEAAPPASEVKTSAADIATEKLQSASTAEAKDDLSPEKKQAEEERKAAEAAELKTAENALFSSAEGSLRPQMYLGGLCALVVGGQFPAFNFIIAEMILVLTHCAEINWCEWPEMKALLNATEVCPTTWGLTDPLFTDKAECVAELEENSQLLVWVFIIIMVAIFVATYTMMLLFARVGEKFKAHLRTEMFSTLVTLDMGYFDAKSNGTGAMASRLAADTALVAAGYGGGLAMIFQAITSTVLAMGFGFYYNWQLTLVLLSLMPINAIGMGAAFKAQGFAVQAQESAASATAIATEAVAGYRTIATFQMQDHVTAMFDEEMTASSSSSIKNVITTAALYGMLGLGMQFGTNAIAFAYGGHLVAKGIYTADDIMKCFLLIQGIGTGLAMAMAFAPDKIKSEAAKGACFGLILQKPMIDTKEDKEKPSLTDPKQDIIFDNVDFAYPTRPDNPVFKQMSMVFEAGKQTALVGATGCGKSSVVSLLQRFYDPLNGRILIGGVDIRTVNVQSLRACIGLVSQEPVLFAASIADNIKFGKPDASDAEVMEACKRANAHDFINDMSDRYDTLVGSKGSQVSGGQKQRIAIARAIIRAPSILLLDEATSALDSESEKVVQAALDNVKHGRTTIVIAHRLNTIKDSDKIIVLGAPKRKAGNAIVSAQIVLIRLHAAPVDWRAWCLRACVGTNWRSGDGHARRAARKRRCIS